MACARRKGAAGARRAPRRERCPICLELAAAERRHLDGLLAGLTETELGAAYAASDGLCLPHLELALARAAAGPAATRLVALGQEKLRALADDLRRFVDKHDHRVTPRFTDREAAAWRLALSLVAGRAEVFGPQLTRDGADCGRRDPGARGSPDESRGDSRASPRR